MWRQFEKILKEKTNPRDIGSRLNIYREGYKRNALIYYIDEDTVVAYVTSIQECTLVFLNNIRKEKEIRYRS